MYVIIRGHCIEGENLEELAACLFRWMPPWFLGLPNCRNGLSKNRQSAVVMERLFCL